MTRLLPSVVRMGTLAATGPKFWTISSAPAGVLIAVRANRELAAVNFKKLRVSGNIVESPLELGAQDHLEHGRNSSTSPAFRQWQLSPIQTFNSIESIA